MKASMHEAKIEELQSLTSDRPFHVMTLTDGEGEIDLYLKEDWSDWDEIVKSVEAYRLTRDALVSEK